MAPAPGWTLPPVRDGRAGTGAKLRPTRTSSFMKDLKHAPAMWTKFVLFLAIGVAAATLLILELGTLKGAVLLVLSIWAFCRAYYFAFYVIEKYVDPSYRFSGLFSFVRYVLTKKRNG
jgi:hypothetical protein